MEIIRMEIIREFNGNSWDFSVINVISPKKQVAHDMNDMTDEYINAMIVAI